MDFPHLTDNPYPNIDTVDVYANNPEFDYSRWDENTIISLLCVPWDREYKNVVDFENDEARDKYIKSKTIKEFEFGSRKWIQPDGYVKLPVDFTVLSKCNYIAVSYPQAPIPYGDEPRISKFFYFINRVGSKAPNCTEAYIELDYWTTYINNSEISYLMLDTGHAPMAAAATPEKFLSNPIDNVEYLLTPDINVGSRNPVSGELVSARVDQIAEYVINSGDMYAVLALSSDADSADWGENQTDDMRIPSIILEQSTGYANYDYIAVKSDKLYDFLVDVELNMPYFMETIVSCMYINSDFLTIGKEFTICSTKVNKVVPKTQLKELAQLNVDMYDYPDKYKRITKLYTSPYAVIEITDHDGNKLDIKIETIGKAGKIELFAALNLIGPESSIDAHLVNIGSTAINDVQYHNINNKNLNFKNGGDWYNYLIKLDIPQFALFNDQQSLQSWRTYWERKQRVLEKENAYTQALDIATVSKNNAEASTKATFDNTAASAQTSFNNNIASIEQAYANSERSATVEYGNSIASNATANANALASNSTANTNALASNATANTNALANNATANTNALANNKASFDNSKEQVQTAYSNMLTDINTTTFQANKTNDYMKDQYKNTVEQQIAQTAQTFALTQIGFEADANSSSLQIAQGFANGVVGGAPGGIAGSVIGATSAGVGAIFNTAALSNSAQFAKRNTQLQGQAFNNLHGSGVAPTENTVYDSYAVALNNFNKSKISINNGGVAGKSVANSITLNDFKISSGNKATERTQDNDKNTALGGDIKHLGIYNTEIDDRTSTGTLNRTKTTADANDNRSKETADANANRTKTTADANANRIKTTADNNANLTKTTADNNATASKDAAVANALGTKTVNRNNNDATKATADANNIRSFDASVNNYNRDLDLAIRNADRSRGIAESGILADWQNAELNAPQKLGEYEHVDGVISKPQALYVNIKRENDNSIACSADHMLRYGYKLEQAWQMDKKQVMKHFTYWKASDIWLSCCRAGIEDAGETIESIFKNGTTIWSDPDKIGRVSIYDNWS